MGYLLPLKYYAIAAAVNFSTCLAIILLVLSQKRDSRLVWLFCNFTGTIAVWSLFYSAWLFSGRREVAEFFLRLDMVLVSFLPPTFLHFVTELVKRKLPSWVHPTNYLIGALLACFMFTNLFATSTDKPHLVFPYWLQPGILFPIHLLHFFASIAGGHIILFQVFQSKSTPSSLRTQSLIVFWGTLIGFGSGIANYLSWYRFPAPPVTMPLVSFYVLALAYAVLRHQLMDIEVVIKRTLQFAGLVAAVVGVVSLVAFVSQDVLAHLVVIPRWLSNVLAAAIIAGLYGPLNAWLTNVTEKYLFQKKYDYRELLKRFTDEVMVQLNLDQLVKMTVETLTETVKLEGCSLLLVNSDTRQYELVASKGDNGQKIVCEGQEPFITFLRETHEPIGKDGELGKVRFPDAVTERMKQLKARLCLPMEMHDELIGVLCLGKKKSDEEFTKEDLDVLLPVAKTLGIAVSNAQLVDELKKTQAEAAQKEKLAVIGTLSAGINHEICNPLGIVKAQCEAYLLDAQDGILIGKTAQDLLDRTTTIMQVALKQIDRATAITQKLSNFAKPIKDAAAQQVSVAQEIDEVLLLVGHDLELGKIEVVKEMDPNLPPIIADRRQLQEVLFNLIRNAGQAIKPPGTITVRAYTGGGDLVRVEIEDTGSGIAPDKLGKIYDPFFTTKEPGKGTGLGLFIVRQIVERNKGRITVESTVGKGTIFFLEFPVAKAAAVAV